MYPLACAILSPLALLPAPRLDDLPPRRHRIRRRAREQRARRFATRPGLRLRDRRNARPDAADLPGDPQLRGAAVRSPAELDVPDHRRRRVHPHRQAHPALRRLRLRRCRRLQPAGGLRARRAGNPLHQAHHRHAGRHGEPGEWPRLHHAPGREPGADRGALRRDARPMARRPPPSARAKTARRAGSSATRSSS